MPSAYIDRMVDIGDGQYSNAVLGFGLNGPSSDDKRRAVIPVMAEDGHVLYGIRLLGIPKDVVFA